MKKHFLVNSNLHNLFNRKPLKISYFCRVTANQHTKKQNRKRFYINGTNTNPNHSSKEYEQNDCWK